MTSLPLPIYTIPPQLLKERVVQAVKSLALVVLVIEHPCALKFSAKHRKTIIKTKMLFSINLLVPKTFLNPLIVENNAYVANKLFFV